MHTYTGWGSVPYWNAFVANLEMHGQGTFLDSRLDDALRFPIAARAGFGLTRVLSYQAADGIASGALLRLLTAWEDDELPIHLLYPGGRHPPVLDFRGIS